MSFKFTAEYATHKGRSTKTFVIKDYASVRECLLHLDLDRERKQLLKMAKDLLSKDEFTKLRKVFAPTAKEKAATTRRVEERKRITSSPSYEAWIEYETNRMVAHPGFMSNSPF